jgi:hypothetical protein
MRRKIVVSVGGTLLVAGLLTHVLVGRGAQFSAALRTDPITLVTVSVLLQVVGVLARTEAWAICVSAAGGTVLRSVQFRAVAFGCVASIVNGLVGMAVRIGWLRRAAPQQTPAAPALVAAEVPIITVELALVAIFSFTLIAPLSVPYGRLRSSSRWWPDSPPGCGTYRGATEPGSEPGWRFCGCRVAAD